MTGTGFNRMAQTESHTPKHAAPKHAAKTPTSAPTFTPPTPSTGTEPKKGRKLWLIPLIIVAALAGIYLIGVAVFSSRFLPNTTVNGENVSLMSVGDVASAASKSLDGYSGTVSGDGISFTVSASDVGLAYDGTSFANTAHSQLNAWEWPVLIASSHNLTSTAGTALDEDKLTELVNQAIKEAAGSSTEKLSPSQEITYDSTQKKFVLTEKNAASEIDADAATTAVASDIKDGTTDIEIGEECLLDSTDSHNALNAANAFVSSTLTLTLGGQTVYTVDADQIAQWVVINDDYSVTLDNDAIATFCHGTLSAATDTVGTARTFTNPRGETVTVAANGTYGWSINGDEDATQIETALAGGTPTSVELTTNSSAAVVPASAGAQDWGTRYVEVSISQQHAWFYDTDGSLIWEADVVTGLSNGERDTPQGVWYILSKSSPATLTGPVQADTGQPAWTSQVDFWMGVTPSGCGFHNAPWRSSFGGDIYTYNGSHGCINLSYDNAQALYGLINLGDVVVIHA